MYLVICYTVNRNALMLKGKDGQLYFLKTNELLMAYRSSLMLKIFRRSCWKKLAKKSRGPTPIVTSSSFGLAASVALRRLFANCRLPAVSFSFYVSKLVFANFRWGATPFRLSLKIIISLFQLRISKSSDEHNKIRPKCIATETGRVGRNAEVWSWIVYYMS